MAGHRLSCGPWKKKLSGQRSEAQHAQIGRQELYGTTPIVCPRFDEIVAPDVIAMLWPQSNAGAVVPPQPTAGLVFGGNFQAFPSPDALHPILDCSPSGRLQQSGDSS